MVYALPFGFFHKSVKTNIYANRNVCALAHTMQGNYSIFKKKLQSYEGDKSPSFRLFLSKMEIFNFFTNLYFLKELIQLDE